MAAGEHVDSKNIKKDKNDVFRLTELIDPTAKIVAPQYSKTDSFRQPLRRNAASVESCLFFC